MANSTSRKGDGSSQTQTIGVSNSQMQNEVYDPALVSLFAQSVSKEQAQSTCQY